MMVGRSVGGVGGVGGGCGWSKWPRKERILNLLTKTAYEVPPFSTPTAPN